MSFPTSVPGHETTFQARATQDVVDAVRVQFPALRRQQGGEAVIYLDGPAGTQVPQRVADAVREHLLQHNANHGGVFATSRESDAIVDEAHLAAAQFVGASDPQEVAFGGNMTTLTMHLSRALGRTWNSDDEIIVTRLDHDANVRPWVLAAHDAGARVHFVPVNPADCTLDMDTLRRLLNERTRLVAVGAASNSVGTINPIQEICRLAHAVDAEVFVDAVHFAPHALIDVVSWDCDFLACSAYKFFGPHVGILWGRRQRLEMLTPYKLNPAPDDLPGKWMTGTQNFSAIAGALAAIDYLADLGRYLSDGTESLPRRGALRAAFDWIQAYESQLVWQLIKGLSQIEAIDIYGIVDARHAAQRMPTISLTSRRYSPAELATALAARGIFAWHGNYYAWELSHALGKEPGGMLRMGLAHYNTPQEVTRVIETMAELHA